MARAIWKGSISFGLVNIPIGLYPATRKEDVKFRLLRKSDLSPVNYKRVAEKDGKEVPWDQIVKGYEYEKGKYIVLKEEDMIHTYNVRHMSEREGRASPVVTLKTFHNLGEANKWAAEQLGNLYVSINHTNTGRSELYDKDNLYRGRITIQDIDGWEELIWVIQEITYVGDLVDFDRAKLKPRFPPKAYNIMKLAVTNEGEVISECIATATTLPLANKIAAEEYLALAAPVSAHIDKVKHFRERVVVDINTKRKQADEQGIAIELEAAENEERSLELFKVQIQETRIRGPPN